VAFGKKKSKDEEQGPDALAEAPPEAEAGDPIDSQLFASDSQVFASPEVAPEVEPSRQPDEGPVGASAPPAEAPAAAPAADPLAGPDLLSMFQTTTVESDDKAALLELAGEVEIDDLLEDLQTVAAALGIKP
jgi:hypothetical protein